MLFPSILILFGSGLQICSLGTQLGIFLVFSVPCEWLHLLPESPGLSRNATSWWNRKGEGGEFNLTKSITILEHTEHTYIQFCIVLIAVKFLVSCFSQMYSMHMERAAWWRAWIHQECGDLRKCSSVCFNCGSTKKNTTLGTPALLSSAYQRHKNSRQIPT